MNEKDPFSIDILYIYVSFILFINTNLPYDNIIYIIITVVVEMFIFKAFLTKAYKDSFNSAYEQLVKKLKKDLEKEEE